MLTLVLELSGRLDDRRDSSSMASIAASRHSAAKSAPEYPTAAAARACTFMSPATGIDRI